MIRASGTEQVLKITGLNKWFGPNQVLRDIQLDVHAGEHVVILGPSGSGKSTLCRCINLLEEPQSGSMRFLGHDYGPGAPIRRRRMFGAQGPSLRSLRTQMGMVFQQFNLWPHLTAVGNVTLGLRKAKRMSRREAEARARQQLERVGLSDKANSYPAQMSGGQQQRVAIARALVMEPRLMLFDEPTSALDPELITEVLHVMRELADEGMTMVVVTHEINFASHIADQVIFMDQGAIVERGGPSLITNPRSDRAKTFFKSVLGREFGPDAEDDNPGHTEINRARQL